MGKTLRYYPAGERVWRVDKSEGEAQRRHPDLNRGMEVLQTSALPLGYAAHACRAGDRARTGDPNLGKVVLYQLSYTRIISSRKGRGDELYAGLTIANSLNLSNKKQRVQKNFASLPWRSRCRFSRCLYNTRNAISTDVSTSGRG